MDLKAHIRDVPDFPKPGILFRDISPLLADAGAWKATIDRLADVVAPHKPQFLAGIESRGFLVTAPLALRLGVGFLMVRKRGKLPGPTVPHTYALEYGEDTIEVQENAVPKGARVVVLDDVLATGGTLAAAISLLQKTGADVRGAACLIELTFLEGRKRLPVAFESLVRY
ncbi:MAG: adenine phosphoribosyltransferase [Proteobacteria bacterium]|nr:adenine phosphoribosyltransferase [Pseudomonadota bacterium]